MIALYLSRDLNASAAWMTNTPLLWLSARELMQHRLQGRHMWTSLARSEVSARKLFQIEFSELERFVQSIYYCYE